MAKVGDKYIFHLNGVDYRIDIVNVNDYREPSMKYDIVLLYDENGEHVWAEDVLVCIGDDFLYQCENVNK